jgi:hypothetical protein
MAETIDRHLERMAARGQADRRDGAYLPAGPSSAGCRVRSPRYEDAAKAVGRLCGTKPRARTGVRSGRPETAGSR